MNSPPIPYFVKPLGYSAHSNEFARPDYEKGTIGCLIDHRARSRCELPAVGMAVPGEDNWGVEVFSYGRLAVVVNTHAHRLVQNRVVRGLHDHIRLSASGVPPVVALLSNSSLEMLINFLALVKIGYAVLLIDPQCTTGQITHLLAQSASICILASRDNKDAAFESAPGHCIPRLLLEIDTCSPPLAYRTPSFITESTIAYIHHSNGITGMPELVLCPHSSAISGLAYQGSYDKKAAFTTTPLYYGGIMDFMRSLMGYSMLWLYPSTIPIIPRNLLRALSVCQHPRAHYFSSVPYVLEVCAEDIAVVDVLKDMDIVGVDGAPLEKGIGDFLVENGVKLVSRFETSECGFLMSSYRSFQTDMGWEYLRVRRDAGYEFISPRTSSFDGDGRFELEVLSDWPQMNCRPNTPRGGYATGDLFVPHPSILDAYKHVGRIDSRITLSNGKKLDPTVIERALGESELALDSFVFGDGRPFPGILVFPGPARNVPREDVFKLLSEENVVAKIVPDMIVFPLPHLYPLRNSAWQIMRQTTLEIFEEDIRKAYREYELGGLLGQRLRRDDIKKLEEFVRSVVVEAIGEKALARKPLESTADLFRYGIDSITAAHIRNQLLKGVEIDAPMMSPYVVYEQTSIAGIAEYIFAGGEGVMGPDDREVALMVQLVRKYDAVDTSWVFANIMVESEARNEVVLLTGATGSLGRQVARQIVTERPEVTKLYCLCRKGSKAKMEALISELRRISSYSRGLSISSVVANLDLAGIEPSTYDCLREVTIIIHAAWSVGLLAPLSSFERPDISRVQQLLRLARECESEAHFVFCSSMASQGSRWYTPQLCSHSLGVAGGLGYFRSKWVAEEICKNAALAGQTVSIIRIGQLSGSTSNGAWSQDAGWPMVIGTLGEIGCLPDFELELSWLPVDLAARGVLDIAVRGDRVDTIPHEPVFNLGNTDLSTSWSDVLGWLEKAGARFKRVTPTHWLEEIEKLEPGARSRKIYPLWKALFELELLNTPPPMDDSSVIAFSSVLGAGGEGWKLDHFYIELVWKKWVEDGFVP